METAMISNYVKDDEGKSLGLIVGARLADNTFNVDYSMVHVHEDKFDKHMAREVAVNRACQARKNRVKMRIMNEHMLYAYFEMVNRSFRYFKGCEPSEKVKWLMEKYDYKDFDGSFSYTNSPNRIEPRYVEWD